MWIFGLNSNSGFSARSTAEQVTKGVDGTGLVAIVTGNFASFFKSNLDIRKQGLGRVRRIRQP